MGPSRSYAGPDASSPQVTTYYIHPTGHSPWIPVQPLKLNLEIFAEDISLAPYQGQVASARVVQHLNSTMQGYATTVQGVSDSANRQLTDVRNDKEVSSIR